MTRTLYPTVAEITCVCGDRFTARMAEPTAWKICRGREGVYCNRRIDMQLMPNGIITATATGSFGEVVKLQVVHIATNRQAPHKIARR